MTWLGGWLKELVLIVLLASFVDMILPSRSMERYVKLVLSLLILLTLLSPIARLLSTSPSEILGQAFDLQRQAEMNQREPTLEEILAKGSKLKQQQEQNSMQWAGNEVAKEMKAQLEEYTGLPIHSVQVTLAQIEQKESELKAGTGIQSVVVQLAAQRAANEHKNTDVPPGADSKPIKIEPVAEKTVNIRIEPISANASDQDKDAQENTRNETAKETTATSKQAFGLISGLLWEKWGVDSKQVQVFSAQNGTQKW